MRVVWTHSTLLFESLDRQNLIIINKVYVLNTIDDKVT